MAMYLIPKRKTILATSTNTVDTIENTITNNNDIRNLGYFNTRLQIPVGVDMFNVG